MDITQKRRKTFIIEMLLVLALASLAADDGGYRGGLKALANPPKIEKEIGHVP